VKSAHRLAVVKSHGSRIVIFPNPVAKTTDIAPGTTRSVRTMGGDDVLVCNVDGTFYAIANVCTHDGWPLDQGDLCGTEIE